MWSKRLSVKQDADRPARAVVTALLQSYLAGLGATRFIECVFSGDIDQVYDGSAAHLSANWFDIARAFKGNEALFAKGFAVVPRHLSKGLLIATGKVVSELRAHLMTVQIRTDKFREEDDQVVAMMLLAVLPAGGLRVISESQHEKRQAIASLGIGMLNNCYLRFSRTFWSADVVRQESVSAQSGHWTEWFNLQRAICWLALLWFNLGNRGRENEARSDRDIVVSAIATMRSVFGNAAAERVTHQITRWVADLFACGAYSVHAVGSNPAMRNNLTELLVAQTVQNANGARR
jgi:hypothetical protein